MAALLCLLSASAAPEEPEAAAPQTLLSFRVVELPITPGTATVDGTACAVSAEHEVIVTGPPVRLIIFAMHDTLDLAVRISRPDGSVVAENEDGGGGRTPCALPEVAQTTTLTIRILAKEVTGPTLVRLHLNEARETPTTLASIQSATARLSKIEAEAETAGREVTTREVSTIVREFLATPGILESFKARGVLFGAASLAERCGGNAVAVASLRPVEQVFGKVLPPHHPAQAALRTQLATNMRASGDTLGARALDEQVLEALEHTLPDEHPDLQTARQNLGLTCRELGDWPRALALEEKVLQIRARKLAPDDPLLRQARQNLAVTLQCAGRLADAKVLQEQVLETATRGLLDSDEILQKARQNLAVTLRDLGDLERARSLEEQVMQAREGLGSDHPSLQAARQNLGITCRLLGDLARAQALEEAVLEVRQRLYSGDNSDLQDARVNLAATLIAAGDFDQARILLETALEVYGRTASAESLDVQIARGNLATVLSRLGDPLGAKVHREQVSSVLQRLLPPDHPKLQEARLSLAVAVSALGDRSRARVLAEGALEVYARTVHDSHPGLQRARTVLAGLLDDRKRVMALRQKVLEVYEQTLRGNHVSTQNARLNLATSLKIEGDWQRAKQLEEEVLRVYEESLSEFHPDLQIVRHNLATTLEGMGDEDGATALRLKVFEASAHSLPLDHRDWQLACVVLSWSLARSRNILPLQDVLTKLAQSLQLQQRGVATGLSPRQASAMAGAAMSHLTELLSFSRLLPEEECRQLEPAMFCALATLQNAATTAYRIAKLRPVPGSELAGQIYALRKEAAAARSDVARVFTLPDSSAQVVSAIQAKESAESKLIQLMSQVPGAAPLLLPMNVDGVARSLKSGEAAVTFLRATLYGLPAPGSRYFTRTPSYIAFVVRPDGQLRRVDLGAAERIDDAAARWSALLAVTDSATDTSLSRTGAALGKLVLEPVLSVAGEGLQRLFVVADGRLCLIPLDALPAEQEVAGDRLEICVLTSLRDLLLPAPSNSDEDPTLLACGNIDYLQRVGADADADLATDLLAGPIAAAMDGTRGGPPSEAIDRERGGHALRPLPATSEEVAAIVASFDAAFSGAPTATVLTRDRATRAAILTAAARVRYVHLATHGWYAPEEIPCTADHQVTPAGFEGGPMTSQQETVTGLSPFVLCGVAVAGARTPDGGLDSAGIITAEEIAGLDLPSCELAVLSACDTSLGHLRAGQGVSSLQQALSAAGAHHALTSLWKVPDAPTRTLMTEFYRLLWKDRLPVHRALWQAKQSLRQARTPEGELRYSPRDWAAWVLTGVPSGSARQ